MIVVQTSGLGSTSKYGNEELSNRQISIDIGNITQALQGKIRFGTGTDNQDGENISGRFIQYTSNGVANTEDTIAHNIGSVPVGYLVLWQDKAGSFYQSPTVGTDWNKTNIYLKCSVASVTALLFVLK